MSQVKDKGLRNQQQRGGGDTVKANKGQNVLICRMKTVRERMELKVTSVFLLQQLSGW